MKMQKAIASVLVAIALLTTVSAWGALPDNAALEAIENELSTIRQQVEQWDPENQQIEMLDAFNGRLGDIKLNAIQCAAEARELLTAVDGKLAVFGEETAGDSREIKVQRQTLVKEKSELSEKQAKCKLFSIEATEVAAISEKIRQKLISRKLTTKSFPIWEVLRSSEAAAFGELVIPQPLRQFESYNWLFWFVFSLMAALPLAIVIGKQLRQFEAEQEAEDRLHYRLAGMYGRRLPWIAFFVCTAATLSWLGATPLAVYLFTFTLALSTSPLVDAVLCFRRPVCQDSVPGRIVWTLSLFAIAAYTVPGVVPEKTSMALILLQAVFFILYFITTAWLLFTLSKRGTFLGAHGLHWPLIAILLVGPLAFLLGYHNLGLYLIRGVYGSLLIVVAGWLVYFSLLLLLGEYAEKDKDKDKEETSERPVSLGRRIAFITVSVVMLLMIVRFWSIEPRESSRILQLISTPYEFGEFTIVPSRWLIGLILFVAFWMVARALSYSAARYWHAKDSASRGARQSVITLTGYAIVATGALTGLSVAGLQLSNLAIIAGALSVGIGFGLQNIVNNFVSGLILLFERPIRSGDWVQVGQTEGYVRQIRIRSTLIETFDRSEVMVPNSDLLNNHVINRTFTDGFGRIAIAVGVAYGSDKRVVRDILLNVARQHPLVMSNDPRVPSPRVLFMNFGESSLDFELRCFIQDVDYKLSVMSDLRFAIDDAFKEHGVEIPFPQRVVHTASVVTGD